MSEANGYRRRDAGSAVDLELFNSIEALKVYLSYVPEPSAQARAVSLRGHGAASTPSGSEVSL